MHTFIATRHSYDIRKANLVKKSAQEKREFLKNQLNEIEMNFQTLGKLVIEINELQETNIRKGLSIVNKFKTFSEFIPTKDEDYGYFGLYYFEDAKTSIKIILKALEEDEYNWFDELQKLRTLVIFHENIPIYEQDVNGNNYESTITDYGYYEEINEYISQVEDKINTGLPYEELLIKISSFYKTVKELLLQISDFYNDSNIFLEIFINKNNTLFNDIENISIAQEREGIEYQENSKSILDEHIIQISENLKYDTRNNIFIDIKSKKEYRHSSDDFTLFMEILLDKGKSGNYVNMIDIANKMQFTRYEEGLGFVKKVPTLTSTKIRTVYGNLKKALKREFEYKNSEEDICGGCRGGFRIPFLMRK